MALGPINYQMQVATPFESVLQGMRVGAQMADVEVARQQQAVQMEAMRQKAVLEQQAAQRAAANEAELQQLQAVPFEQMSRQQQLRLMQLTNSEANRAFIGRQLEQMPAAVIENRLRRFGSVVNALALNPEIGVRLLRESAEAEQSPAEKKALEDAARNLTR
jgi:transcriptional regulator of nitric oxide reductase